MDKNARIAALEAELANLRKQARTRREPNKGFGGLIQRLREERLMSLTDLAENSGISKGLVSRIERQVLPKIEVRNFMALASGLQVSAAALMAMWERRALPPRRQRAWSAKQILKYE